MTSSALRCPSCGSDDIHTDDSPEAKKLSDEKRRLIPESKREIALCADCQFVSSRVDFEGLSQNYDRWSGNEHWRSATLAEDF